MLYSSTSAQSGGTTKYYQCSGASSPSSNNYAAVPFSGTFLNFYANLNAAPGSGNSATFTLYVNGAATGLTVTISNASTSGSDLSHSASVTAGQTCEVQVVFSTSATSTAPWGGIELDAP